MMALQALKFDLQPLVQAVVSSPHITKQGIGPIPRQHLCMQHRIAPRRILKRRIGMPKSVGQPVKSATVVGFHQGLVGRNIGNVGDCLSPKPALGECRRPGLGVQFPVQALSKCCMFVVSKLLIAEHQHSVLIHRASDFRQNSLVHRVAQIDWSDYAEKT